MHFSRLHAAAALALALAGPMAAPATAQSLTVATEGILAPCTQTHFEPGRYLADLAAAGWVPVPDEAMPIAVEMLSEAFLPVTHPQAETRTDTVDQRLTRAQAQWGAQVQDGVVLILHEAVLFLRGLANEDGAQMLECWLVSPDGDFVDDLLTQADAEAAQIRDRGVAAAFGPDPLDDRHALGLIATRQPVPQGLAHGMTTQLARLPEN